ncbi:MAG: L-glutamate gamma-semialdehyde dehydrogenase, partial [Planctomycetota bacterium]
MQTRIRERELAKLTHRIGDAFFDTVESCQPHVLQAEWWHDWLMNQWMRDEELKVQTFRLIDALPALRSDEEIARHLREYLSFTRDGQRDAHAASADSPGGVQAANGEPPLRNLIAAAVGFRNPRGLWARCAARAARSAAIRMARTFIAGRDPDEAEQTIRAMRNRQLAFTIDVLGEAAVSESEAEAYQRTYLHLINELCRHAESWPHEPLTDLGDGVPIPKVNVSVKLTSIYSKLDPIAADAVCAAVKDRLRPLLRAGMRHGAHIHIDMEHYAVKDLTLRICREVFCESEFRDYPHFGIVLQAYLKDGDRDVADTVEWVRRRGTPIWVRLVKGAYWDTETVLARQRHWPCPVWEQKWQSDACYERMTRVLLENHEHICGAFASHNIRSLSHALALRQLLDVPRHRFELQMLYGMGDPLKRACVRMGERCRVYT